MMGKALTDLSDLDQHVKRVYKVREHPRGNKKNKEEDVCPCCCEDRCAKICVGLELLRKRLMENHLLRETAEELLGDLKA